jgi:hypothetical protein
VVESEFKSKSIWLYSLELPTVLGTPLLRPLPGKTSDTFLPTPHPISSLTLNTSLYAEILAGTMERFTNILLKITSYFLLILLISLELRVN